MAAGFWVPLETKAKSISAFAINEHLDGGFLVPFLKRHNGAKTP